MTARRTSAATTLSALVATLALCLAGVVCAAPAQAAVALSGTVVLPSGYLSDPDTDDVVLEVFDATNTRRRVQVTSVTGAQPTFSFTGLASGASYVIQLWDNSGQLVGGYLADAATGALTDSSADAARLSSSSTGLKLRPVMTGVVDGTVTGPSGFTGAIDGTVELLDEDNANAGSVDVAADGSFRVVGLAVGAPYVVRLSTYTDGLLSGYYSTARTGLARTRGEATTVIASERPIVLRPRRAATMSGTLRLPPGVDARPDVVVNSIAETSWADFAGGGSVSLADDGTFAATRLDPEIAYTVGWSQWSQDGIAEQYLADGGGATWSPQAAAALTPRAGLVLRAAASTTVTGTVVVPDGVPTHWSQVLADREDGTSSGGTVADDGTFVVDDLTPGERVRIGLSDGSGNLADGWWVDSDRPLASDLADAAVLAAAGQHVTLRPVAPTISGTVSLPAGSADGDGAVLVEAWADKEYQTSALVDPDGAFTIRRLAVGKEYALRLSDDSGTFRTGYLASTGELVEDEADARTVVAGTAGVTLRAQVAGTITAHVGLPAGGSAGWERHVVAYDAHGDVAATARVVANDDVTAGDATIRGLAVDEAYTLRLDGTGLATGWYAGDGAPTVALRSQGAPVSPGTSVMFAAAEPADVSGYVERPSTADEYDDVWVDVLDAATGEHVLRTREFDRVLRGLDVLSAGTYVLGVERGAGPSKYAATYYAAGTTGVTSVADATPITVSPGHVVDDVVVTATTCATLAGTVDVPVARRDVARVRLWSDDADLVERSWTGSPGADEFRVTGLSAGTYHVGVRVGGGAELRLDDVTIPGCTDVTGVGLGDDPRVHPATPARLTGTPTVGKTLTVGDGTWQPSAESVTRQWYRGLTPVAGATGTTYVLQPADLGRTISVAVTARSTGHRPTTVTVATESVVARATMPDAVVTVPAKATAGATVTASVTPWKGTGVAWEWTRDGWPIAGATSAAYTLSAADAGHTLRAVATGSAPGTLPRRVTSGALAAVPSTPPVVKLASKSAPTIPSTVRVGVTAKASAGKWTRTPAKVTYQWLRDGKPISRATAATYKPVSADRGRKLSVRVTASVAGQSAVTATSASRVVASGKIANTALPKVKGTVRVGKTLRAGKGTWTPTGLTYRYVWLRNGVTISKATGSTYRIRSADKGKRISVRVTASRTGYTTTKATSKRTAVVPRR